MLESLQGVTSTVVRVALDGLAQQQRLIANNIANANSAGYSARHLEFENALRAAADIGAGSDSETVKARVADVGASIDAGDFIHRNGDSTVQLDIELARMNETVLKYQALLRGLDQSGSFARMAISGDGAQ